ncbi:MAG: TPM domain-containing protein [Dysgonamonadaceae bacterium]|jgi:uncharacterized protein|nr:TPM domain-containing protein [Dysgonamonadaceae bacterium]
MKKLSCILLSLCFAVQIQAQGIPEPPNPPRLVNDFARVLTAEQVNQLEFDLTAFARNTTTQIIVVTVPTLGGYDIADYSFKLGEKWGAGQKGKNNGVVIVFKPKTGREPGRAFVAIGYGLEGVIPDAIANRIVNKEMIPHFRDGDIYGGLRQGCKIIMSLASKEFTAQEYDEKTSGNAGGAVAALFLFLAFMIILSIVTKNHNHNFTMGDSKSGLPFWVLMSMLGSSGRGNSRDWDNFTRGSGGFGGFGGFGGGSFGGGGAGGSW